MCKDGGGHAADLSAPKNQVEHFPSACQVLSRCNWTPMHCAAYLGALVVSCCFGSDVDLFWGGDSAGDIGSCRVAARPLAGLGVPGPNTSSDGYGGVLGSPRSSANRWVTAVCCDVVTSGMSHSES